MATQFSDILNDVYTQKNQIEKIISKLEEKYSNINIQDENVFEYIDSAEDFFLLMSFANAQRKSGDIENFLRKILGLEKVPSSANRGDAKNSHGEYFEFKTSTSNRDRKLNAVQIRLYQDIDYYILSYIDETNIRASACFRLTHDQMKEECELIGTAAHGTKSVNDARGEYGEYAVRLQIGSGTNYDRWVKNYWYSDLYNLLTKG